MFVTGRTRLADRLWKRCRKEVEGQRKGSYWLPKGSAKVN